MQHRVSPGILVATLSFTYPTVEYPSLRHKYWYNIRGNIPRIGQGLEIMLMKDGQPATFQAGVLDVEGWRKLPPEDKKEGFRAAQRPRKLTLTNPAVPPLLEDADSTSFMVAINSIKALGHTAGQDTWQNLLTAPTARAHASLALPNALLSQRPEKEDSCQRRIGIFIALAHILTGGHCSGAAAFLPDQARDIAQGLSPAEIATALWEFNVYGIADGLGMGPNQILTPSLDLSWLNQTR